MTFQDWWAKNKPCNVSCKPWTERGRKCPSCPADWVEEAWDAATSVEPQASDVRYTPPTISGPGVLQAESSEVLQTAEAQRQLKALKQLDRHIRQEKGETVIATNLKNLTDAELCRQVDMNNPEVAELVERLIAAESEVERLNAEKDGERWRDEW